MQNIIQKQQSSGIKSNMWNIKFELSDKQYVSDMQQEIVIKILRIRIYVNKVSIRIAIKIKIGYCLKHLTAHAIKKVLKIR